MTALSAIAATQPRLVSVLQAALASRRMHQAYLLVGPEEGAARELASAFAGSLVCASPSGTDACGQCAACRKLAGGNHPDVVLLSPNEKGIITVDQVREVSERLALKAAESEWKVVLIAAADVARPEAQNALLKTLEEPPGATCFLLTATRLRALLPTVRSRCVTLRLMPRDRLGTWRDLEAGGIEPTLARALGPLVGDAVDRAAGLVEEGAEEIHASLDRALAPGADLRTVIETAADLGSKRERADLALALLEVRVRDALARRRGVADELCYGANAPTHVPPRRLALAAARLATLRRLTALHVNRTLALEAVLRDLGAGQGEAA
jgi:DNA polymerase-3 subunit delta'